jgi:hypothetical protein
MLDHQWQWLMEIQGPAPFLGQLDEGNCTGEAHGLQTPRKQIAFLG